MKRIIAATLAVAGIAMTAGCGSSDCAITDNGQKLCGADAAAWCRATDYTRTEAPYDGPGVSAERMASEYDAYLDARATCRRFEKKYSG